MQFKRMRFSDLRFIKTTKTLYGIVVALTILLIFRMELKDFDVVDRFYSENFMWLVVIAAAVLMGVVVAKMQTKDKTLLWADFLYPASALVLSIILIIFHVVLLCATA